MPVRTYVAPTEYDATQEDFTVADINGNLFLQIGALSSEPENQKFIESLIDGQTGFFQDKKRIGKPVRYNEYTLNGVPIDTLPELAYGEAYHIRFTQARPGRDGRDGSGTNFFNSFLNPFPNGMRGRFYGSMTPYPKFAMNPFPDSMSDKFHSSMRGIQANETEETATDILHKLNGQPDLVRDFVWDLIMDRVPELRDANTIYNLISPKLQEYTKRYSQQEKDKLLNIEAMATADQSASEVIALLNALPRGSRLNVNWFDGELNIPTNTVEFHGQFQLNTAYGAGDMVIDMRNVYIYIRDVPATNTTRPGSDTRAEHLDSGSPADLIDATKSGLTFTLVRRSGDNINLTISNADLVTAFQSMSTTEKARVRTAIGAQIAGSYAPSVHNHDSRYYTEAESNSRFAPNNGTNIAALIDAVIGTAWRVGIVGPRGIRGPRGPVGPVGPVGPSSGWSRVSIRSESYYAHEGATNLRTVTGDLIWYYTTYRTSSRAATSYSFGMTTGSLQQEQYRVSSGGTMYGITFS